MADASQDVDMQDVNGGEQNGYLDERPGLGKLRVLPGETERSATFEFTNEDHTLGNALRYMIMKDPDVEFCGYSIPHPSDPKMNLRIQCYDDASAYEVLDRALTNLVELCEVVTEKFSAAKDEFEKKS